MNKELALSHQITEITSREGLSEAGELYRWVFDTVKGWVKGKILEIKCGSGFISEFFIQEGIRLRLSDSDRHYYRVLKKRFGGEASVKGIHRIEPEVEGFEQAYTGLIGKFDTVMLLNIVDHQCPSSLALNNIKKLLREGGYLIVMLRANSALYHDSDLGFKAWRKQNLQSTRKLLGRDFEILATNFFQVAGNLGWYLSSSNKTLNADEKGSHLYRQKVAFFRVADEILFHKIGLSVIAIGRKINHN